MGSVEHLRVLSLLGFKRLSLGIQDFDPVVQRAVNRVQTESQVRAVTEEARAAGFTSINYDLIYGLPFQTRASVAQTVEVVRRHRPERIAFYAYAHVPWFKPGQRHFTEDDLPVGDEKRALYELGREMLEELRPTNAMTRQLINQVRHAFDRDKNVAVLLDDELAKAVAASDPRSDMIRSLSVPVTVDRERARASAWYEFMPRSQSKVPGRHGTFNDAIARLPEIAAHETPVPADELGVQRLLEPERAADLRDVIRRRVGARDDRRRIAGRQMDQHEVDHHHAQHQRHGLHQPPAQQAKRGELARRDG